MEIDPTRQIQSISEFRTRTEELLKTLSKRKTILLTQHGKTRAILVDPDAYERQLERLRLAERLLRAERELDRGEGLSDSEVVRRSQGWTRA